MKREIFILSLIAAVFTLFTNNKVNAQTIDSTVVSTVDTTANVVVQPVPVQTSTTEQDKQRLQAAKNEARDAKRQAREAEKMDDAAEKLAKETKRAARLEAKAQRTRKKANKAAKKVTDD